MRWDDVVVCEKIGKWCHHGVPDATIVGAVFHLIDEDIIGVDFSRNVSDFGINNGMDLTDMCFLEVEALDAFAGDGMNLINHSLVVVVGCVG